MIMRHLKPTNSFQQDERINGHKIRFRLIHKNDGKGLEEGFSQLSRQSRLRRFLKDKATLTEQEIRFITSADGVNHYVLVALSLGWFSCTC